MTHLDNCPCKTGTHDTEGFGGREVTDREVTDIDNLRELFAKATPGTWGVCSAILKGKVRAEQLLIQPTEGHEHPNDFSDIVAEFPWQHFNVTERHANADLITALHNAFPALASELEAARKVVAAARETHRENECGDWPECPTCEALAEYLRVMEGQRNA